MKRLSAPLTILIFLGLHLTATGCQLYQPRLDELMTGTSVDEKTKQVTSPAEIFPAGTVAIYASVLVRNASTGARLRATWDWTGHALNEPTEIDASGTRFAAFNIQRPRDGWRSGNYTVTIEIIDTDQRLSKTFAIE